jgi:hypothetical protein
MASLNRARKRPEGLDYDFFLNAQDYDEAWEKNMTTETPNIEGIKATVNLTLIGGPSFGESKLKIGLKKEAGVWKIDSVNGNLNPS